MNIQQIARRLAATVAMEVKFGISVLLRGYREDELATLEVSPHMPQIKRPPDGGLDYLVPRRGLEPPPTYVD